MSEEEKDTETETESKNGNENENENEVENQNEDQNEESSSGEEESSEDEAQVAEPLATTRSRRSNAGNRMSRMIQDEEDEFYSNLYGGFHEEDDDADFDDEEEANEEEVEDDYDVDSDFSIDETDEIAPEYQMVEDEPKKRQKGYKDPKPKGQPSAQQGQSTPISTSTPKPKPTASSMSSSSPGKNRAERTFRDSTRKKTEETIKNIQIGTKKKKKKRNLEAWKPLTQEELLAEAKITEEENLKSLETYQRLESEKLKKIKQVKKTLPPPYITYFSTTMPIIDSKGRYSRNFITFVPDIGPLQK